MFAFKEMEYLHFNLVNTPTFDVLLYSRRAMLLVAERMSGQQLVARSDKRSRLSWRRPGERGEMLEQ